MSKKSPQKIDINTIENPAFLKGLSIAECEMVCDDIRKEIIRITSIYGGHLSSNLGVVELTLALHKAFDFPNDKLIFDVGHQCYTHKILTGRKLEHLYSKGAASGFQKMSESEYDCYEAGHSSTSLSAAEAFAIARDLKNEHHEVVALIGDGSLPNGLAFEALNDISGRGHKVIIVLNDNDMSITPPVGGMGSFFRLLSSAKSYNKAKRGYQRFMNKTAVGRGIYRATASMKRWIKSKLIPATMFDNMGFEYIKPVDGHDIKALLHAFKKAKKATKSVVIHVHTTKGKGYVYAENDKTGYWHGVTPYHVETGIPKDVHPGYISWSHYFADLTEAIMAQYPETYLVVPATMKGSGLERCFSIYKDRTADVGIAEEHAITMAGALTLNGYHPIVSIYSTFLQRAYDELSHDCARIGANMTILIDRAGLIGKYGETHQGIYDVAFLKTIPNVVVTMPSDVFEAKALYHQSIVEKHGVYCIRLTRNLVKDDIDVGPIEMPFGKWKTLSESEDKKLAIIGVGPNVRLLENLLKTSGYKVTLINPIFLHPVDLDAIKGLKSYKNVIVYDAYGTKEGFAEEVAATLSEVGFKGKLHIRAVPNAFVQQSSVKEQEEEFGLLPEQILEIAKALLSTKK